jgi:rare lipoprotein A
MAGLNQQPRLYTIIFIFLLVSFSLPPVHAQHGGKTKANAAVKKNSKILYGQASFYASKFQGRKTANGEIFNHEKLTAACNVLPLGTTIRVTNLKNGKTVVVKTNDRLHPKTRRLIDLTRAAAKKLGFISHGLTRVKVEVLEQQ